MKTSTIAVRVADFLKQHPPFDQMKSDDLLELAHTGRIKFHEQGELIFEEGDDRDPFLFVIQQGTVRLVKYTEKGDELIDMRTEGDLLGISWLLGEGRYTNTAKADSDTMIYALPWDEFLPRAENYPEVGRYLAAYFSAHLGELPDKFTEKHESTAEIESARESANTWLDKHQPLQQRVLSNAMMCLDNMSVMEAARLMSRSNQDALVVVDIGSHPVGIITETDLVRRVATGNSPLDAPVSQIMSSPVRCISPERPVRDILLLMMKHRLRHVCVTNNGLDTGHVIGLISEHDIQLLHGRVPTALAKEIHNASEARELAQLRQRTAELLLIFLETRASLTWLADFIQEVDSAILQRAIQLTEADMLAEGYQNPKLPFCWLAMGREGRRERFLMTGQKNALIYADPSPAKKDLAEQWFERLADGVTMTLSEIGYESMGDTMADNRNWRRPLSEWKNVLKEWINNPIDNDILNKIPFFDARVAAGDASLTANLRRTVDREIHRNPRFIPLMANDSLQNLPPLTIFRDSVMDQEGVLWTCIDTKLHALRPLADAARVMSLQLGMLETTSTVERFRAAAQVLPKYAQLFNEAAEAARITLFYQTIQGLRAGDDGRYIRPADLKKIDHEKLKSVFRVVVRVLDFMRDYFNIEKITYNE